MAVAVVDIRFPVTRTLKLLLPREDTPRPTIRPLQPPHPMIASQTFRKPWINHHRLKTHPTANRNQLTEVAVVEAMEERLLPMDKQVVPQPQQHPRRMVNPRMGNRHPGLPMTNPLPTMLSRHRLPTVPSLHLVLPTV